MDHSGRCYRCGDTGHVAKMCVAKPRCPVCTDLKRPADHALGSKMCAPQRVKRKIPGFAGPAKNPLQPTQMEVDGAVSPKEQLPQRELRLRGNGLHPDEKRGKSPIASTSKQQKVEDTKVCSPEEEMDTAE